MPHALFSAPCKLALSVQVIDCAADAQSIICTSMPNVLTLIVLILV